MTLVKPVYYDPSQQCLSSFGSYGAIVDQPGSAPEFGFQSLAAGRSVGFASFDGTNFAYANNTELALLGAINAYIKATSAFSFNDSFLFPFLSFTEADQGINYLNNNFDQFVVNNGVAGFQVLFPTGGVSIGNSVGLLSMPAFGDPVLQSTGAVHLNIGGADVLITDVSGVANNTSMQLNCNIGGVQTMKRVVRDAITHVLSAP